MPLTSATSLITQPRDITIDMGDGDDAAMTSPRNNTSRNHLRTGNTTHQSQISVRPTRSPSSGNERKKASPKRAPRHDHKSQYTGMIDGDVERLERALRTNSGVAAGERLFTLAQRRRVAHEKRDASVPKQDALSPSVERECTFHPTLCEGTTKMIDENGGYRPPSERFDAQELRLAKARILQLHASHSNETVGCTFTPVVDTVSRALVRRSRSASVGHQSTGCRLFHESAERHNRQQAMNALIKANEECERVGGHRRLQKDDAEMLSGRLAKWKRDREHNVELMRQEEVLSWRPPRSRSCDDNAVFSRLQQAASPARSSLGADASSPSRGPPRLASERSKQLADELQKSRFRALFTKYVPSASQDGSVTVHMIRHQVKKLFPYDAGILEALQHVKADSPLRQDMFVAALCAFERRYGPQPWGRMEHHRLRDDDTDDDDDHHALPKGLRRNSAFGTPSNRHGNGNGKPIFDQLLDRGAEAAKRLEQKRAEHDAEVARLHTFRPTLRSKPARSQTPPRPTTPVSSTTASHGGVQGGFTPRTRTPTPQLDDVDSLLKSIDKEVWHTTATTMRVPVEVPSFLSATQPPRPKSPGASSSCGRSPPTSSRTPFKTLDWNRSATVRSPPHTPPSALRQSPKQPASSHKKRSVTSFAAEADNLLDGIYCEVSAAKRYTSIHNSPPRKPLQRPKSATLAHTLLARGSSKPFR